MYCIQVFSYHPIYLITYSISVVTYCYCYCCCHIYFITMLLYFGTVIFIYLWLWLIILIACRCSIIIIYVICNVTVIFIDCSVCSTILFGVILLIIFIYLCRFCIPVTVIRYSSIYPISVYIPILILIQTIIYCLYYPYWLY